MDLLCTIRHRGAAAVLFVAGSSLCVPAFQAPVLYTETRTTPSTFRDRGTSYAPMYLIYADGARSADEGKALIDVS